MSLTLIESIKKETRIDSQGRAKVSIRGAARIVGVTEGSLRKAFKKGAYLEPSELTEIPAESGVEGAYLEPSGLVEKLLNAGVVDEQIQNLAKLGIPDTILALIIEYYAFDAARYCTGQALQVFRSFAAHGLRSWLQQQSGWQQPVIDPPPAKTEALPLPEQSLRSRIVEAVDNYCYLFGISHQQAWTAIYRKLNHLYQYDVSAKLKGSGTKRSKLEQIEFDGKIEELRSVAQQVLRAKI